MTAPTDPSEPSILLLGDLCLAGSRIERTFGEHNHNLCTSLRETIGRNVRCIANLECAITTSDDGIPHKWATLKCSPKLGAALSGLDIAILGNNHISDFGDAGVQDTLALLKSMQIAATGYGQTLSEAMRPATLDLGSVKISVLSLCCPTTNGENNATNSSPGVAPLGSKVLDDAIRATLSDCDALIVFLHWGQEQVHDPVLDQLRLARVAIDAGADAVVGCHSHVIQSYECYKGRWIFYGLGNFLFDSVETRWIDGDGKPHEGVQHQQLKNRQSLAPEFSFLRNPANGRLKLKRVHFLQFDEDFAPRIVPPESLAVDIARINTRLRRFCSWNADLVRSAHEPTFKSFIRNGVLSYHYLQMPISDSLALHLRSKVGRLARRLKRGLGRLMGTVH